MTSKLSKLLRAFAAVAMIGAAVPMVGCLKAEAAASHAVSLPAPAADLPAAAGPRTIVLAGGCFWGVQGVFQHVRGVTSAVSGYAGGTRATAQYEAVSSGRTRHAEAVRITYDPKVVSYGEILRIFFSVATDPTQLNMQFPDRGPQYRNAIFYQSADQKRVAEAYIAQLGAAKSFGKPIVTTLETGVFYPAEAHHQDFLVRNPTQGYIATYDMPKLRDLKRMFPARYSAKPVLVGRG